MIIATSATLVGLEKLASEYLVSNISITPDGVVSNRNGVLKSFKVEKKRGKYRLIQL